MEMFCKLKSCASPKTLSHLSRALSTSCTHCDQTDGWLSKLLVRKIEPSKESHSRMLSDKEKVYEFIQHDVKPGSMDEYLENYESYVKLRNDRSDVPGDLIGSWTVGVGDQDQALHLWRFTGGYSSIDSARKIFASDPEFVGRRQDRLQHLRMRTTQFLLPFSYWPVASPRSGGHLYEVRSYALKPGTMIEWGNNWAKAINFRKESEESFGGFFSQVGHLYHVHHIWCYKSLQHRKETREAAWRKPGWDECVAYTVPLIREMQSRILIPTRFSPTN